MPRSFLDQNGTQHVFEDGTPDSVVAKVLGPEAWKLGTADSNKVTVRGHVREKPKRNPATGSLPYIGGAIGGTKAGVAGATVGGMAGELAAIGMRSPGASAGMTASGPVGGAIADAFGDVGGPVPSNLKEFIDQVGGAGAMQGGMQLGGTILGKGIQMGGKAAGTAAFRFLPEVAQTAINEGITATRAGFQKGMAKLGEYGARTMAMLRVPTALGVRFNPQTFLSGAEQRLIPDLTKVSSVPRGPEDAAVYARLSSQFLSNPRNQVPITPIRLQEIKQAAQDIAKPLFERMGRKEEVSATDAATAKWYKALADHAKEQLEAVTPDMIHPVTGAPMSLAESNAQTQAVKAVVDQIRPFKNRAVRIAASPLGRAAIGAGIGAEIPGNRLHNAAEGALFGTATTPQALSTLALAAHNPLIAQAIANIGRAGGFVLGQ